MKQSLTLLLVCLSASLLQAQDFTNAVGLRFGYPTSISFKHFLDDANAVEGFVGLRGYGGYRSTSLGAAYQRHQSFGISDSDFSPLQWYYGAGASVHFWSYTGAFRGLNDDFASTSLGISGYIGLQYAFDNIPLELTLDARPTLFLGNVVFNSFGLGYGGSAPLHPRALAAPPPSTSPAPMSRAYPPTYYDEPRLGEQLRLAREWPLATFCVADDGGQPYVTPVPLVLAKAPDTPHGNGEGLEFLGHLDANNPAAAWVRDGRPAVAVFHGRSGYISPDDYRTRQLPTYNYEQVHVHGRLRRISDADAVAADMRALVVAMEGEQGWRLRADDPRVAPLLPHVVAFRLVVGHIDGRFKTSQDKRADDRAAAAAKLR